MREEFIVNSKIMQEYIELIKYQDFAVSIVGFYVMYRIVIVSDGDFNILFTYVFVMTIIVMAVSQWDV